MTPERPARAGAAPVAAAVGSGIGIREYARHRRVSPAAVRKAIESGRIRAAVTGAGDDRLIDPALADRLWDENTQPSQQRPAAGTFASSPPAPGPAGTARRPARPAAPAMTMAEANLLLIKYRARRERIEYLREIGRLVDAGDARKEAFELARTLRDRALELPGRLADELAAETDPRRIRSILEREVRDVFAAAAVSAEVMANSSAGLTGSPAPPAAPAAAQPPPNPSEPPKGSRGVRESPPRARAQNRKSREEPRREQPPSHA